MQSDVLSGALSASLQEGGLLTTAPPSRAPYPYPYLCAELSLMVLEEFALDHSMPLLDFIVARGALLAAGRSLNTYARCVPGLWSRILVSPRVPLPFVLNCLHLSDLQPLFVSFDATPGVVADSITHGGVHCSPSEYVVHAAEALAIEADRCAGLAIEADSPDALEVVLDELHWTTPYLLTGILVRFKVPDYTEFRPLCIRRFRFSESSALGEPFPLFTSLTWIGGEVVAPVVSFATAGTATAQIIHPSPRPLSWHDVLVVIVHSPHLETLALDGLQFSSDSPAVFSTPPLPSLVNLELTFRGMAGMARLVSCLNAPAIRTLKLTVLDVGDFCRLGTSSALLSNVRELVLAGTCQAGADFFNVFAMLHRLERLDLRPASPEFFYAFARASRRTNTFPDVNWNACPLLVELLVSGVTLTDVMHLLQDRQAVAFQVISRVVVANVVGGWDPAADFWFHSNVSTTRNISPEFWTDSSLVAPVTTAVFHNFLDEPAIPPWKTFAAFLMQACNLTRISLRHFSCGLDNRPFMMVSLPSLVELDMCFCGKNIVGFIASCDMPALRSLSLLFSNDADLDLLLLIDHRFAKITTLSISGTCNQSTSIACAYMLMPLLTRLNISNASPSFVHALYPRCGEWEYPLPESPSYLQDQYLDSYRPPVAGSNRVVCPSLLELSVDGDSLNLIRTLLELRSRHAVELERLDVSGIVDPLVWRNDEDWLVRNVGRLTIDGEHRVRSGWVWRT
ncbi:hypothetical protein B0H16DRAFT_1891057 [Mycena metata]|uniref:Uncharacterized protein n=1 Tax=Mycena metata TaxID=1033252 RepID=A0AAD7IBV0_9AGAR|nr:hypothetical protein B0H16DRAFT_1891057 [Mycena metata]